MAKKTAIELLIRELNRRKKVVEQINDVAAYEFEIAIKIANRYLKNEKEQIKDAFVKCWELNIPDGIECKLDAEEYYNKTYGSQMD